jgi:hypothetical protein
LILRSIDRKTSQECYKKTNHPTGWINKACRPGKYTPNPFFSPETKLTVSVDGYYGASVIFGAGVTCDGSDSYCVRHKTFDHTASSTFTPANPGHHFEFSLGTAEGPSGSDDLEVDGTLKLNQTMFGVAQSIPRHLNRKTKDSGFLAMNAPETEEDEKTTMQKVVEQASKPQITFHAPA